MCHPTELCVTRLEYGALMISVSPLHTYTQWVYEETPCSLNHDDARAATPRATTPPPATSPPATPLSTATPLVHPWTPLGSLLGIPQSTLWSTLWSWKVVVETHAPPGGHDKAAVAVHGPYMCHGDVHMEVFTCVGYMAVCVCGSYVQHVLQQSISLAHVVCLLLQVYSYTYKYVQICTRDPLLIKHTGCTSAHTCWLPRLLAVPAHTPLGQTMHIMTPRHPQHTPPMHPHAPSMHPQHAPPHPPIAASQPVQLGVPMSIAPLLSYGRNNNSIPVVMGDPCCTLHTRYVRGECDACMYKHCVYVSCASMGGVMGATICGVVVYTYYKRPHPHVIILHMPLSPPTQTTGCHTMCCNHSTHCSQQPSLSSLL